jgi:hypothetical protein
LRKKQENVIKFNSFHFLWIWLAKANKLAEGLPEPELSKDTKDLIKISPKTAMRASWENFLTTAAIATNTTPPHTLTPLIAADLQSKGIFDDKQAQAINLFNGMYDLASDVGENDISTNFAENYSRTVSSLEEQVKLWLKKPK